MTSIAIDRNDGLSSATAIKGPCRVAATSAITLSGLQTIDGVVLAAGDRVLYTAGGVNAGIWIVDTGSWRRAKDFAGNRDVRTGTWVFVTAGTVYASTTWYVVTANPIVIGTTSLSFALDRITPSDLTISTIGSAVFPSTALSIRPVGFTVVDPLATTWKKISTPGVVKPWQKADITGQYWELADHVTHPFMFGNVGKGADDTTAFQYAFDRLAQAPASSVSAEMVVPPGYYQISEILLGTWDAGIQLGHYKISGRGAHLSPRSGGSAGGTMITINSAHLVAAMVEVEGFTFNHNATHNHLVGLKIIGSANARLHRNYFSAGGRNGSFYAMQVDTQAADSNTTGSYWSEITDNWVRRDGSYDITFGLILNGAHNAMLIARNKFTTIGGTAILLRGRPGDATPVNPNSVQCRENAIEGNVYGIHYEIPSGQRPFGFRGIGNRFENTIIPWRFTLPSGSLYVDDQPALLDENIYLSYATVMDNPAAARIDFRDIKNRWGEATILAGNTSVAVSFASPEYTDKYLPILNAGPGSDDATLRVTNRGTSGFTINRTGTTGDLVVEWMLVGGRFA